METIDLGAARKAVCAWLDEHQGGTLAPGSDKDLLELKMLSGCDQETKECMAGIGSDLATDRLLYGKVEKRDNGYQVSLKLLDVANKTFERSISDLGPPGARSARAAG